MSSVKIEGYPGAKVVRNSRPISSNTKNVKTSLNERTSQNYFMVLDRKPMETGTESQL